MNPKASISTGYFSLHQLISYSSHRFSEIILPHENEYIKMKAIINKNYSDSFFKTENLYISIMKLEFELFRFIHSKKKELLKKINSQFKSLFKFIDRNHKHYIIYDE